MASAGAGRRFEADSLLDYANQSTLGDDVSPLDCVDAAGEVDLPIELFVSPFGRGFGALQQQKDGEFVLSHDALLLELCCNNLVTRRHGP